MLYDAFFSMPCSEVTVELLDQRYILTPAKVMSGDHRPLLVHLYQFHLFPHTLTFPPSSPTPSPSLHLPSPHTLTFPPSPLTPSPFLYLPHTLTFPPSPLTPSPSLHFPSHPHLPFISPHTSPSLHLPSYLTPVLITACLWL